MAKRTASTPVASKFVVRSKHGVRINTKSEIRLARPVLQVVPRVAQADAVRHRPREVGDLILLHATALQPLARGEVEVGGEIVVGNKVRVVAAASCQQLAAQARVFVHLQHVHADVRHAGGKRLAERKIPALLCLVRQAGDQIDADVADAGGSQPRDVIQRDRARMQPADRRTIPCPRTTARPG